MKNLAVNLGYNWNGKPPCFILISLSDAFGIRHCRDQVHQRQAGWVALSLLRIKLWSDYK